MQISCYSCHNHFTMRREEVYAALDQMVAEDLSHHNAVCPRCGKSNKVSLKQLKRWAPQWEPGSAEEPKEAAREAEKEEAESKGSVKGKQK
jgi:Fe2+ or Zn2+ uptake regulation protein